MRGNSSAIQPQTTLGPGAARLLLFGCALAGCIDSGVSSSGPPFQLSVVPSSLNVIRGASAPFDAQILSANRNDGPVTFTLAGAPAGTSVVPGSMSALPGQVLLLSMSASAQTQLGTFPTVVTATYLQAAGAPSASASVSLEVVSDDGPAAPDAGFIDAGFDAGGSDAGFGDAGSPDSGVVDAGVVDAGEPDAGAPDAGEGFDGGLVPLPPDAGVSSACPVQASSGSESVALQIDAAHTGAQPNDTLTLPFCHRWVRTFDNPLITTPAISRGRVFITLGSDLYALNEANGQTLWGPVTVGSDDGLGATSPVLDQGRVYVVGGSGLAQAFDQVSGAQLWSTQLAGEPFFTGDGDPIAFEGRLFVEGDGSGAEFYALDGATGRLLWTALADGLNATPTADVNGVYMSLNCGPVYAYAPATGTLLWMAAPPCYGSTGDSLDTLYQGRFYTGASMPGGILDVTTGVQIGSYSSQFTPAFIGEQMILSGVHQVSAQQLPDLSTLWTVNNDGIGQIYEPSLPIGQVVLVPEIDDYSYGKLLALDGSSGALLDSSDISSFIVMSDGQIWNFWSQTAADGMYFVSIGTSLVAY